MSVAMTASKTIKGYINKMPKGEPFTSSKLRHLASADNVRKILSRMVKSKDLISVARGVYVKPERIPSVGTIPTPIRKVVKVLVEATGETVSIHGAEDARSLRLSSQVPLRDIYYTSGTTRTLTINQRPVMFKHVCPSKLIATGTIPGKVINALRYLGKENVNNDIIRKVEKRISEEEFIELNKLTQQMPLWMANAFYCYNKENKNV